MRFTRGSRGRSRDRCHDLLYGSLLNKLTMPEDEAIMKKNDPSWTRIKYMRIHNDNFIYYPEKRRIAELNEERSALIKRRIRKMRKPIARRQDERLGTWACRNAEKGIDIHAIGLPDHHGFCAKSDGLATLVAPDSPSSPYISGGFPFDSDGDLALPDP